MNNKGLLVLVLLPTSSAVPTKPTSGYSKNYADNYDGIFGKNKVASA